MEGRENNPIGQSYELSADERGNATETPTGEVSQQPRREQEHQQQRHMHHLLDEPPVFTTELLPVYGLEHLDHHTPECRCRYAHEPPGEHSRVGEVGEGATDEDVEGRRGAEEGESRLVEGV